MGQLGFLGNVTKVDLYFLSNTFKNENKLFLHFKCSQNSTTESAVGSLPDIPQTGKDSQTTQLSSVP